MSDIRTIGPMVCYVPRLGNILCMYVLHEYTDCLILTGIHIKCTHYNAFKYTVQNMFINLSFRYVIVDFIPIIYCHFSITKLLVLP